MAIDRKGNHGGQPQKEERANLLLRILAVAVRICTIALFVLAGLAALLLIAVPIADLSIFGGFFTGQVINLLIQTDRLQDVFTLSRWMGDNMVVLVIIMVLAIAVVVAIKRFFKRGIRGYQTRPTRAILTSIVNLVANLALFIYAVVFVFNIMSVSYVENFFNRMDKDTVIQLEQAGYSDKVELVRSHLDEKELDITREIQSIMRDVENGSIVIDDLNDEEYRALALRFAQLIDERGSMPTMEEHYFRNVFSRAPATLQDMIGAILIEKEDGFDWSLVPPESNLYHMYGEGGEFNMKFTSKDGHFEAVYNKDGELLTAENDPVNMGTFNYACADSTPEKHAMGDVLPYFVWNNVPDIALPEEANMDKYYANADAQEWYAYYSGLLAPSGVSSQQ